MKEYCERCKTPLREWEWCGRGLCEVCEDETTEPTMPTATRTIALTDAARLKAALTDAGVRVAVQIDGDDAQLIYLACDAQAAADAIAAELSR